MRIQQIVVRGEQPSPSQITLEAGGPDVLIVAFSEKLEYRRLRAMLEPLVRARPSWEILFTRRFVIAAEAPVYDETPFKLDATMGVARIRDLARVTVKASDTPADAMCDVRIDELEKALIE